MYDINVEVATAWYMIIIYLVEAQYSIFTVLNHKTDNWSAEDDPINWLYMVVFEIFKFNGKGPSSNLTGLSVSFFDKKGISLTYFLQLQTTVTRTHAWMEGRVQNSHRTTSVHAWSGLWTQIVATVSSHYFSAVRHARYIFCGSVDVNGMPVTFKSTSLWGLFEALYAYEWGLNIVGE